MERRAQSEPSVLMVMIMMDFTAVRHRQAKPSSECGRRSRNVEA